MALPASSASPTVQALLLNQHLRKDPRVKKIKVTRKIIRNCEMIQVTIFKSGMSSQHYQSGVSIIFKIRVFYKARFEGFEFFIRWPYAVFYKMQVVFYKSVHFMYL